MSQLGIDIAWARPSVAEIKNTGAHWVARYFSHDPTKDLTAGEVTSYTAAGLAIVTVFETTTGRALQGRQAGIQDAQSAINERSAVGLPHTAPIYWAVDTDTDYASVKAYADGWATLIPKSMSGPYGGYKVVQQARQDGWAYGWQTIAWSGGLWSSLATIKQTGGTVLSGGADIDYAEVPDFGQYPRPNAGEDLPTPFDVWAYKGPGDTPDVHQTLQNIAAGVAVLEKQATASAAQEAAILSAINKLSTIPTGGVDPNVVAQDVIHELGAVLSKA